jgi:hypothetical protein
MAIGTAVQRGSAVYIYDENRRLVATVPAGHGPADGLVGFTGSTVSIRRGASIHLYDERGRQTGTVPGR